MKLKKKIPKNEIPFKEVYSALSYCKNKESFRYSKVEGNCYVAMTPIFIYKVENPIITKDFTEVNEFYSIPKQKVLKLLSKVRDKLDRVENPLKLKELEYERNVTFYGNRVCVIKEGKRVVRVSEKIFRIITKTFNDESCILLPPEDSLKEGIYVYSEGKEMFFMPFGDSESPEVNYTKEGEKEDGTEEERRNKPKLKLKRK